MALIQDLDGDRTEIAMAETTFLDCYCRVREPISLGRETGTIQVDWWLSQAVRNEGGKRPLLTTTYICPGTETPAIADYIAGSNGNLVMALYNWLKDQPDFSGAINA